MNPTHQIQIVPKTEKLQVLVDGKPVELEVFPSAPGSAREIVVRLPDGRLASLAATAQTFSKLLALAGAQIQSKLPAHASTKAGYKPGARTAFEERIRGLLASTLVGQAIGETRSATSATMRILEVLEQATRELDANALRVAKPAGE